MRKAIVIVAVLLMVTASLYAQQDKLVLMCVGNGEALADGETTMKARLESMGMVVDAKTASETVSEDAANYDMIFVHENISSSSVGAKFKEEPTPLMSTEFYIADDMGFCGSTGGTDYGQLDTDPQTDFLIVENSEHPITKGYAGEVVVYDGVGNMGFAVPQGDAVRLLSYAENPDKCMLFTYEAESADMNGDPVPARRVFFFTFNGYEAQMTDDAWTLFERSVKWVIGVEDDPGNNVDFNPSAAPATFQLEQNYPNPFNPVTNIYYELAENSDVTLEVFNTRGEIVASLVNGNQNAGQYSVSFNASNLPSGIYLYQLQANDQVLTKKMVLAR